METGLDTAKIVDGVREKVRSAIIDMIPKEAWDKLIQTEVDKFTNDRYEKHDYSSSRTFVPSGLSMVVSDVMKEETKKRTLELLNSPEWQVCWNGNSTKLGSKLAEVAAEAAPKIFNNMISEAVGNMMNGIRNGMQTYR